MSVAVTGAGCISALGRGLEASLAALLAGNVQPLGAVTVDTTLDQTGSADTASTP